LGGARKRGALGVEFERRRRENRGAQTVGAEGERFLILALRMVGFGAFWVVFFKVELFVLHAKISVLRIPKLAIARCIIMPFPRVFF